MAVLPWKPRPGVPKAVLDAFDLAGNDIPEELRGLTAEHLADLFDQTTKFGMQQSNSREWHVTLIPNENVPAPIVVTILGDLKEDVCHVLVKLKDGKPHEQFLLSFSKGLIVWDARVSIEAIEQHLSLIDATVSFTACGFLTGGRRYHLNYRVGATEPPVRSVEKIFKDEEDAVIVLTTEEKPALFQRALRILEQFDRPEDLDIMEPANGPGFLILKKSTRDRLSHRSTLLASLNAIEQAQRAQEAFALMDSAFSDLDKKYGLGDKLKQSVNDTTATADPDPQIEEFRKKYGLPQKE